VINILHRPTTTILHTNPQLIIPAAQHYPSDNTLF